MIFVRNFIKNIITFFEKLSNYDINNIVFIRFEKIDNEVHEDILLLFINHNNKNK